MGTCSDLIYREKRKSTVAQKKKAEEKDILFNAGIWRWSSSNMISLFPSETDRVDAHITETHTRCQSMLLYKGCEGRENGVNGSKMLLTLFPTQVSQPSPAPFHCYNYEAPVWDSGLQKIVATKWSCVIWRKTECRCCLNFPSFRQTCSFFKIQFVTLMSSRIFSFFPTKIAFAACDFLQLNVNTDTMLDFTDCVNIWQNVLPMCYNRSRGNPIVG